MTPVECCRQSKLLTYEYVQTSNVNVELPVATTVTSGDRSEPEVDKNSWNALALPDVLT